MMRDKLVALIVIFAVTGWTLTACQHQDEDVAAVLTVAETCKAYSAALRVLTPYRAAGVLTQEQIAKVDLANQVSDDVCLGPPPEDPVDAVNRLLNALAEVMLVVGTTEV